MFSRIFLDVDWKAGGQSHSDLDGDSSLCHTGTSSTARAWGRPKPGQEGLRTRKDCSSLTMVLFRTWGLCLACL